MAQYQAKPVLDTVDPVWARIRHEAEEVVRREPELASFIYSTVLHHDTLEAAVVHRLETHDLRLGHVVTRALGARSVRLLFLGCRRSRRR